jgi:hypothetical protein
MDQDQRDDASEDYGYDLAHEVPSGPDRRSPHRIHPQLARQSPRAADTFTDYGSDEAHDL